MFKRRRRGHYRGHWRRRRRYGPRRRWRRRISEGTARPQKVRQWIPRRHRYVTVRGWEPLANLCMSDCSKDEASPYYSLEEPSKGKWHGTWGKHYFTISNLLLRSAAYWNQWSDDWSGYDYVKFRGATITIPKDKLTQWMINFDPYIQHLEILGSKNNKEDRWVHPGILLNTPGTHLILPPTLYSRKDFYKIRVKSPPGWIGFQRFPEAMSYILFHWCWTWFSLQYAFHVPNYEQEQSTCEQEPWWSRNNNYNKWVDRQTYTACTSNIPEKTWGPFLPPKYGQTAPETSLMFFYKIKFTFSGNSIWRPLPRNFKNDGLVPTPPGTGGAFKAQTTRKKRPRDEADIWPDDLDSDGILKDGAYQRITGYHSRIKRCKMAVANTRRLEYLHNRIRCVLSEHGLLKRLGNAPLPPNGGPTSFGGAPDHPPQ
nr:ORF1 [Torque teno felis virus]